MSDCNGPSCDRSVTRRARKEHFCVECMGTIPKGATYEYYSGVWDGVGASFRFCLDCDQWRVGLGKAIRANPECGLCDCIEIGGLRCALEDFVGEMRLVGQSRAPELARVKGWGS